MSLHQLNYFKIQELILPNNCKIQKLKKTFTKVVAKGLILIFLPRIVVIDFKDQRLIKFHLDYFKIEKIIYLRKLQKNKILIKPKDYNQMINKCPIRPYKSILCFQWINKSTLIQSFTVNKLYLFTIYFDLPLKVNI